MTFDRILILLLIIAVYFLAREVSEWSGVLNTIQMIIKQFAPGMNT
jgi:NhaP-type Na+/H+ or K+/H+ antiporter